MSRHLLSIPLVFCFACPLWADGWPAFRGPEGNGHAEGRIAIRWSPSENIAWRQPIPGEGWSSPVVHEGKLYLTTADPRDGGGYSLRLLRVDTSSGRIEKSVEVFEQPADAPRIHRKNSHASPTPLIDGGRIFVHFGHQGTACLDLDGNVMWSTRDLAYRPVHGNGGTPILVDGRLIFSCDGGDAPFIVALDARTGHVIWKRSRLTDADRTFSFSTPTLIEWRGRRQVISPGSNVVCSIDPQDGNELWRVRYDGYSVIPKPVFGHGIVFICTGYNQPDLLAIRVDGSGDVTDTHVAWRTKRYVPHTPSLLLVGDDLFMVSDRGIASCLDARSGKTNWTGKRLGGNYSASPVYVDGKIYFQSEQGDTTVIEADSQRYEQIATSSLGERTLASYAIVDRTLFLRSADHLYRIEAGDNSPANR